VLPSGSDVRERHVLPCGQSLRQCVLPSGSDVRERHVLPCGQCLRQHVLSARAFVCVPALSIWTAPIGMLMPPG